ncbi:MAG: hypothetical protein J7K84_00825 [Deltaproteobacteria bacterium]|nr:hypothetical protein [Deltaproteobacteria bacterium]
MSRILNNIVIALFVFAFTSSCSTNNGFDESLYTPENKVDKVPYSISETHNPLAEIPFREKDENVLFQKVKPIPAYKLEENMSIYYMLMKINPEKELYREKFFNYFFKFLKTGKKFKTVQWLRINSLNCRLLPYIGYVGEKPLSIISEKTFLKIIDYKIRRGGFCDNVFYKVKYKSFVGWISDFATDRLLPSEMNRIR